jgi:hypothetical protein
VSGGWREVKNGKRESGIKRNRNNGRKVGMMGRYQIRE